jgi:stage V sporulation protein AE
MADDAGNSGEGRGEKLIDVLAQAGAIDAVIAVASDTRGVRGARVDESITRTGQVSRRAVDKHGQPVHGHWLLGDTVDVVNGLRVPVIGIGDLGKAPAGHGAQRVLLEAIVQARRLARESQVDAQDERPALA